MVIVTSGLVIYLIVNWIGGVLWVIRAGGWVPIMPWDLDALIVGVYTEGVEVKIPFDKRPKTRVQGVVGMWFPSSFFRFGSAGVVVCVELGLGVE